MNKRVLVVVAHPDDEALGCGGTMAKLVGEGDEVKVCFLSGGVSARGGRDCSKSVLALKKSAEAAGVVLGVKEFFWFDFPDQGFDTVPILSVTKAVEGIVDSFRPDIVFTHFKWDLNRDHRVCFEAVKTALRPVGWKRVVSLFCFEVLSSSEWGFGNAFSPTFFVDVGEKGFWRKQESLDCYKQEMRLSPHPRSKEIVFSLARLRGSTIGVEYAEAFEVVYCFGFGVLL
jgi:LmbE family N-acetylglucosaminyl deacetylase